jgi:hypothetical protein
MTQNEQAPILIISCSQDIPTWGVVAEKLEKKGHPVNVYEADRVATGDVPFSLVLNDNNLILNYDSAPISSETIRAAWFRRAGFIADTNGDAAKEVGLDTERRLLLGGWIADVADDRWLNAPAAMDRANRKIAQLRLAAQIGFTIPKTVVTNTWEALEALPEQIIYKSSQALLAGSDQFMSLYTTRFHNVPDKLPLDSNPFPGIWQAYQQKAREWRITIVGSDVFDAAIYTHEDAKDDWRKHQLGSNAVAFRQEAFSDELHNLCFRYLAAMGLRYGAFDFTEAQDGTITFLECNPNGQFMWLEQSLGLPISGSIADELSRIATASI